MNVSFILILLLFGAVTTYFVGDKLAKKSALLFSIAATLFSVYILNCHTIAIDNPSTFKTIKMLGLVIQFWIKL